MNYTEKLIVEDFKAIGVNKIDVEFAVTYWNYLWALTEWKHDNAWRIVKMKCAGGEFSDVKILISQKQANELIQQLELIEKTTGSDKIYRREIDWNFVNKYNQKKTDKKNIKNIK
jgi:hypothetical protein